MVLQPLRTAVLAIAVPKLPPPNTVTLNAVLSAGATGSTKSENLSSDIVFISQYVQFKRLLLPITDKF